MTEGYLVPEKKKDKLSTGAKQLANKGTGKHTNRQTDKFRLIERRKEYKKKDCNIRQ